MSVRKLLLPVVIIIAAFTFASTASASYQRFLPSGLPTSSPQAATKAVLDYATLNEQYGRVIAAQTGSTSFHRSDYSAVGWGAASASTMNSALSGYGSAVAYHDSSSVGVRTVRIRNKKTGLLVNVMVRCGNPRIKSGVRVVHKVKIRRILRIWVNKKFTVTKTITCPSGQQVKGTVTGRVRGWFRTRVKGWTTGAKLYYSQQVNLAVTNTLKLQCAKPPTQPPPPTSPGCNNQTSNNTNSGNACQGNNASQESKQDATVNNKCDQTHTSQSEQCNTTIIQVTIQYITQINANCSMVVYSNGDVIYVDNAGNTVNICSSQTTTQPPPPVDNAPQISCVYPAHVYVGGNVYIWCEAVDPDGDALSVNIVGNSAGHISGVIPSDVRWDGTSCPSKTSCYRATFWADNVGSATVTATVNAKGKSGSSVGVFPVLADQF